MSQMNMANADLSSPSLMAPTEEDKVTLLYQL